MNTISLDPVTAALLTTRRADPATFSYLHGTMEPILSFVTVDEPPPTTPCDDVQHPHCACLGPSPWIGQRVAIYADPALEVWKPGHPLTDWCISRSREEWALIEPIHRDAIVGSGTLAEALRIVDDRDDVLAVAHIRVVAAVRTLLYVSRPLPGGGYETTDITDQLPLQSWSPDRWALRFTDVAPTSEQCARCGSTFPIAQNCPLCATGPVLAPVLSGDDPTYKEWTP